MPRFLIEVVLERYIRCVAECDDADEADRRGRVDFIEGVLPEIGERELTVTVEQVDDDEPEGDV